MARTEIVAWAEATRTGDYSNSSDAVVQFPRGMTRLR